MKQNKKTEPSKNEKIDEKISQLKQELVQCNDKYLRALADYRNLDNRLTQEKMRALMEIQKKTVVLFLGIKDDIDNASVFEENQGLKLIKRKFEDTLKGFGVEQIQAEGIKYSEETMECINTVTGKENNIVTQVHQAGYVLHGELIRPAKVTVSVTKQVNTN